MDGPRRVHARTIAATTATRAFAAIALTFGAGCGAGRPEAVTPEQTVRAFARALNEGDLDTAYALMSDDYKQRVSLAAWKKQLGESPDDVTELSNALAHVRAPGIERAVLRYGDDAEVQLQKSDGRWLVATDLVSFYDQSSPRAALRTLVRALERKRYDVVMRLIPNADKEGMTTERVQATWSGEAREEVERMRASLQANLDAPIEIVGNHATMPYGDHARVQFVREDDVWKVEDPE